MEIKRNLYLDKIKYGCEIWLLNLNSRKYTIMIDKETR